MPTNGGTATTNVAQPTVISNC